MSRIGNGERCVRCGNEATGLATINDARYCHGDDERPSCYEQQGWDATRLLLEIFAENPDDPELSNPRQASDEETQ